MYTFYVKRLLKTAFRVMLLCFVTAFLCVGIQPMDCFAEQQIPRPDLHFADIKFTNSSDTPAVYNYTGELIKPEFEVHLNYLGYDTIVPERAYIYSIVSEDGDETSAGINVGKVTFEIAANESDSLYNVYMGSTRGSFIIGKADGLTAENANVSLISGEGSFDLDNILLNKSDCGKRSYSLGSLTDESGILSNISINGSILNYSTSGKKGKAEQVVTITTDNYNDTDVKVTFETVSDFLLGDVNLDGEIGVSDVVMLQKWLVCSGELTCWQNADLCDDGVINVFDLCVLKKRMLGQNLKMTEGNKNMNDSISITSINSISNDFKSKLSEAIINTNPNFDFSDFTFESRVWSNITDENHKFIGERHVLWVYYKNILLNPDKYAIEVYDYYDSNVKMEDDFFKSEILANANKLNIGNYISEKSAAQIAEKYADGLEIPTEKSYGYELGKFRSEGVFDDNIELMIYSLENPQIVYKVSGSNYDYDFIDDVKKGYVVLSTDINVYIDAQTGKIIDHDFEVIMGIS